MPTPVMNDSVQPMVKLRLPKARRSTTGRANVRLRTTNSTPAAPDTQAQSRMNASSNQFQRVPSSSTYSSVPRNTAIVTMPR